MCCDTTARQAAHMGLGVEFLADPTGTLDIDNEAGRIDAEELRRSVLVTQQSAFAQVVSTGEWIARL
jgi:nicotinamidase-related amidase